MVEEKIYRKKLLDRSKYTPEFVDEKIPTLTFKRGSKVRGAGAHITFGSHYIADDKTWKIGRLSVSSGSAEAWFEIRHSRLGTIDAIYFSAKGQEIVATDPYREPIYVLTAGSAKIVLPSAGSANWFSAYLEGPED